MTADDLKRAREVADAIESPYPYLHLNEAASLIRSLCESLLKTADGVPITEGMNVWFHVGGGQVDGGRLDKIGVTLSGEDGFTPIEECYSTRKSALAAAGKEKDAPKCLNCEGYGYVGDPHHGHSVRCERCSGTGKETP